MPVPRHGAIGPIRAPRAARITFGVTSAAVITGLAIQAVLTIQHTGSPGSSTGERLVNLACFFTIQSNALVGATCAVLAARPGGGGAVFRALRLAAVLDIAVTGVVYHLVLARGQTGWDLVADQLLHTAVPLLGVAGWLAFGPRGQAGRIDAARAAMVPLAWVALTLVRGPMVAWYPYPFIDVDELGYGRVVINLLVIAALFVALATAAVAADRALAPRRR